MAIVQPVPFRAAWLRARGAEKFVNNRLANQLGCQVIRTVAASTLRAARRRRLPEPGELGRKLLDEGFVVIPDFLDADAFAAISDEAERGLAMVAKPPPEPDKFGIARHYLSVLKRRAHMFPVAARALLENERLRALVRHSEGWSNDAAFADKSVELSFERLEQVVDPQAVDAHRDEENSTGDLHSDSFHTITKVFLLLSPMNAENGPFTYCPGTQRLTWSRARWEYLNSVDADQYQRNNDFRRRVRAEQLARMGLQPVAVTCEPNTLIVTDTCGFHLRGRMTRKGAVRLSIPQCTLVGASDSGTSLR